MKQCARPALERVRCPHCAVRQVTIAKAGIRPTSASEVSLNARVSATLTISVLVFLRAQHPYPGQRAAQDSPHTCRDWVRDKSHSCTTPDALKHQCLRVARNVAYCSAVCIRTGTPVGSKSAVGSSCVSVSSGDMADTSGDRLSYRAYCWPAERDHDQPSKPD